MFASCKNAAIANVHVPTHQESPIKLNEKQSAYKVVQLSISYVIQIITVRLWRAKIMARILVENTLSTRLLFSPKMLRPRLACPKNVSVKFVVFSLSRNGREFDKETLDFSSEFTATCHRVLIPLLLRVRRTSFWFQLNRHVYTQWNRTRVLAIKPEKMEFL